VVSDEVGLTLAKATLADLGRARRVEVSKDDTTLVGGGGTAAAIQERIAQIRKERDVATSDYEREQFDARIAKLSGGVAVVKVGAATETELKERKIRVEDALHATRAAVEEGIVPGGGIALLRARRCIDQAWGEATLDEDSGRRIVHRSLEEPLRRIVANAGLEPSVVVDRIEAGPARPLGGGAGAAASADWGGAGVLTGPDPAERADYGYNAATGEYGDLLQMGVIDPAKVTRLALQNAASIAGLVLMTDCLIAAAPRAQVPAGAAAGRGVEGPEF
jgi:chaperonin GroEL